MSSRMDLNVLQQFIRTDRDHIRTQIANIPAADIALIVEYLKGEADRHWFINANRSLELAELIIAIGAESACSSHVALGTMARGDALQFLGRFADAWQALDEAGRLYEQLGDDLGWARTRIGRLLLSVDMQCVPQAAADAERARTIFQQHGNDQKQVTLDLNLGVVYYSLGDQTQALQYYRRALDTAEALQARPGSPHSLGSDIALLHNNMGISYDLLGDFQQALACYERAYTCFVTRSEFVGVALVESNMAHIAMAQGNFRRALQLLHQAGDHYRSENHTLDATHASRDMVECFLALNRHAEASELAASVIEQYRQAGSPYYQGLTLLHAAAADSALGRYEAAQLALDEACALFRSIDAHALIATAQLRQGQMALSRGEIAYAYHAAAAAAQGCEAAGRNVERARALLLLGQAQFALGDISAAAESGRMVLAVAQAQNVPDIRYGAHLLLGQIAEARGHALRAARHYRAGVATVERVQHGLTITMSAGFHEGTGEALRRLIRLHVQQHNTRPAFEAMERAKSHVLLGYLADRTHLRWRINTAQSRALFDELERLRAEHHWFYKLAHDRAPNDDGQLPSISAEQARAEVAQRERRMRALTERLYLEGESGDVIAQTRAPRLAAIQQALGNDTLLAFYLDDQTMLAFVVRQNEIHMRTLPLSADGLQQLLSRLERNFAMALGVGPAGPGAAQLAQLARVLLQRLYDGLLAPLADVIAGGERLIIAPYGALHYLPFHLLYNGTQHLIEHREVVVVPTAGLLTRQPARRSGGARVLAHSWDGRLPQTQREAAVVQQILGGAVYSERHACRAVLERPPTTVLHLAAHGEQRLDHPELSFIQLADAQLYTDDLLQHDLSYELVVLSACETGRAHVAAGDELIGLGRGFLYAGAGALITTLWRVDDVIATRVMEGLYSALRNGASKAAALRETQQRILASNPRLHPAFWGAFQLVGDARPLSAAEALIRIEGEAHAESTFAG